MKISGMSMENSIGLLIIKKVTFDVERYLLLFTKSWKALVYPTPKITTKFTCIAHSIK